MLLVAAACALTFCMTVSVSSAVDAGPEEIILKTAKAKKPAIFPHKKHQETIKCSECHHSQNADGTQGPYVEGQEAKCETCHNEKDMANKDLVGYKNIGHARCKSCHKEAQKSGNKNAPTKCDGCHVKK